MNKAEAIEMLHAARAAHVQWRARAQALAAGLSVEKEQIPVSYTDCKFGKWYYGTGQALNFLASYRAIEEPHEQLHGIYMKLFTTLFGEQNKSVWTKLFGSSRKADARRQAEADGLVRHLVGISKTLLESIDLLEKDVKALTDEKIVAEGLEKVETHGGRLHGHSVQ